jgi:hypothetical protein
VVGFSDRGRDRQPEAEAAELAAAERLGSREPAEDPLQFRLGDPAPRVAHGQNGAAAHHPGAEFDAVFRPRVRDRVLEQRVERHRQPVTVGDDGRLGHLAEPPHALGVPPAVERVDDHRVDAHRREFEEARVSRAGEQQQAARQPAQPREFADDHLGVLGDHLVPGRLLDELGVAERHRDRRAELVRGVEEELPLLLKQAQVLRRDALHLFHRDQSLLQRRLATPSVPDHREEHERDHRDQDQVVRVLLSVRDLRADDPAGGQGHHSHRQHGRLQPPHPPSVDECQAYPDDEEGDRRPGLHRLHSGQVDPDEQRPDDVQPRGPRPAQRASQRPTDAPCAHVPASHHVLSTGTLIILLKALTGGFQSTLVI